MTYQSYKFTSGFVPPSQRQFDLACEECAEFMSRDYSLPTIARKMELSVGTVCVLFRLIGERVGELPS